MDNAHPTVGLHFVHYFSNFQEPRFHLHMTTTGHSGQEAVGPTVMIHPAHGKIKSCRIRHSHNDDNNELHRHRTTEDLITDEPDEETEEVEGDDHQGRADMGEADLDEEMMEMTLVGMERTDAPHDTSRHHPEGVEDGHAEDTQGEGADTHIREVKRHHRAMVHEVKEEDRHEHAHHHRTTVTDEHLCAPSEDVMDEEGDQSPGAEGGDDGHRPVMGEFEDTAEGDAGEDTESR